LCGTAKKQIGKAIGILQTIRRHRGRPTVVAAGELSR
jgi:hypothetical protein